MQLLKKNDMIKTFWNCKLSFFKPKKHENKPNESQEKQQKYKRKLIYTKIEFSSYICVVKPYSLPKNNN